MKMNIRRWEEVNASDLLDVRDPYRFAEVDGDNKTVRFFTPDRAHEIDGIISELDIARL